VDGLLAPTPSGRDRRVSCIEEVSRSVFGLVRGHDSRLSRGGMDSKLRAAQSVTSTGCLAVIANGRQTGVLGRIMRGEDVGTLILADAV
jgi:glutamate 5-kinase